MIAALVVSNILLWIAVVGLAGIVFALLRQIGVLHERVAPAGALMSGSGPQVGEPAPVLQVENWNAEPRILGGRDAEGQRNLLLFVSPTCPVCKTVLSIARAALGAEYGGVRLILASDGPRTEHEAFVREHGIDGASYFLSSDLGLAYKVGKLPYAVLIDADGVIRARGLVNTREHLDSLFEAEARGVASLQEYLRREREGRRVA